MNRLTWLLYLAVVVAASFSISAQATIWHPVEKYCAEYEIKGMAKGTLRVCQRKHGEERIEYTTTTIGFGPFKKTEVKRTIYTGETIYSFTEGKSKIIKTKNPLFKTVEQAHENQSPEEASEFYLQTMGFGAINGTDSAAGISCNKRSSAAMGGFICMTDDLIPVITSAFGQKQILTSLEKDTEGGAEQFDPNSYGLPIEEGPDVSKLLEQFSNMRNQSTESTNDQEN